MAPNLLTCSIVYWARLAPYARREQAHWRINAQTIPDARTRRAALDKLDREGANAEAAAFFALLADRDRLSVVRRIVAFEVLYELLDSLSEEHPTLDEGLRMHRALAEVAGGPSAGCDGYQCALIEACRGRPSHELFRAVQVVSEAQSHNHAMDGDLQRWSESLGTGLLWWEAAAAGIACLGVHALLATDPEQHAGITSAYVEIDALGTLLDALVDYAADLQDGNHNFLTHYADERQMVDRLVRLTADACDAIRGLPGEAVHRMAVAGLLAYNLSAVRAPDLHRQCVKVLPLIRVGLLAMRLRRVFVQ